MAANMKDIREEAGSIGNMPAEMVPALAWESPRPTVGVGAGMQRSRGDREPLPATTPARAAASPVSPPAAWHLEVGAREVETCRAGTCSTVLAWKTRVDRNRLGQGRS